MGLSDLEEEASMRDEGSCWLPGLGGVDSKISSLMDTGCSVC